MIKARIASAAATVVVGIATIGGTALTIAVPANAAPSPSGTTSSEASNTRQATPTLRTQTEARPQFPQPSTKKDKKICQRC